MSRLNFYVHEEQELAAMHGEVGARAIHGFACLMLMQEGFVDKARALAAENWIRGWPKVRQGGAKQHKVQIKQEIHDRLVELSKSLGLSMSRTTLVWLQLAAKAMQQARAQGGGATPNSQPAHADTAANQSPAKPQPDAPLTRVDFGGIYPPAPGEQVLTRVVDGRSETWLHCRIHKDMTADQVRDIGNAGAIWVESDIYDSVMAQKLNLDQMMALVMQRRAPVGNSSPSGQVIELPQPARAVAQASTSTATDTGFGFDAVAWMANAASVWDKQP